MFRNPLLTPIKTNTNSTNSNDDVDQIFEEISQAYQNALWDGDSQVPSSTPFDNQAATSLNGSNSGNTNANSLESLYNNFGYNNFQKDLVNDVSKFLTDLNAQGNQNNIFTGELGMLMAFQGLKNSLGGIEDIYKMAAQNALTSEKGNADLLNSKRNYLELARDTEDYIYSEVVQEKLTNTQRDLTNTEMQNRFSLSKTAAATARYG